MFYQLLKPIFHQNAKYLASGVGVGQCTRRQNFALPNAKDTNMLVYFALADANFLRYPTPNPRRQSVEYRWRWASGVGAGVGHVHFFFFVLISFAFCSQRKSSFQWNMGFSVQHSCSSPQSFGSSPPSIVETRGQLSRGFPLLFLNRSLGSLCALVTEIIYTHSLWQVVDHSRNRMHYTCLIIIHDPIMRLGLELNRGPLK